MPRKLSPRSIVLSSYVGQYQYSYKGCLDWESTPFGATFLNGASAPMRVLRYDGRIVVNNTWLGYLLESLSHTSIFTCVPAAKSKCRMPDVSPEVYLALDAYTAALAKVRRVRKNLAKQPSMQRWLEHASKILDHTKINRASLFGIDYRMAVTGNNYAWWGMNDTAGGLLMNIGPISQEGFTSWAIPLTEAQRKWCGRVGEIYGSLCR